MMELVKAVKQTWEYKLAAIEPETADKILKDHGDGGWEAVGFLPGKAVWYMILFKRPVT